MGVTNPIAKILQNLGQDPDSFSAQYRDERWIQRAKQFRRNFGNFCQSCKQSNKPIHVHHLNYSPGVRLWDAEDQDLCLLCKDCHDSIHETIRRFRRISARCNAGNIAAITRVIDAMVDHYGDQKALLIIAERLR